jgi:hypothetical protein
MGTVIEPVPVTGFAANFSPIPRIAPPPLGRVIAGGATLKESCCVAELKSDWPLLVDKGLGSDAIKKLLFRASQGKVFMHQYPKPDGPCT